MRKLERVALYLFGSLSAIGFAWSAAIHLWTFASDPPESRFPGSDVLGFGVFPIVGGAALLGALPMRKARPEVWSDTTFAHIPIVLKALVIGVGLYGMSLSIEQTTLGDVGVPAIEEGRYVLHNHGRLVKVLTAEEYRAEEANVARVRSIFLAGFYLAAVALTIGALRMPRETNPGEPSPSEPTTEFLPPDPERPLVRSRPAWKV